MRNGHFCRREICEIFIKANWGRGSQTQLDTEYADDQVIELQPGLHAVMDMKVNTSMRSRGALEERTRQAPVATPWQDARARSPPDPCVLLLMMVSLSRLPGSAALTPRPPERPAGWLTAGPLNGLEAPELGVLSLVSPCGCDASPRAARCALRGRRSRTQADPRHRKGGV